MYFLLARQLRRGHWSSGRRVEAQVARCLPRLVALGEETRSGRVDVGVEGVARGQVRRRRARWVGAVWLAVDGVSDRVLTNTKRVWGEKTEG